MSLTADQQKLLELYNNAMALYKQRKWQDAMAGFKEARKLEEDPEGMSPSKVYIERCEAYIKDPPGDDWDGVFTMKTK